MSNFLCLVAGLAIGSAACHAWWTRLHQETFREYRLQQSEWVTKQLQRSAERERAIFAYPRYTVRVVKGGETKSRQSVGLN